MLKFIVKEQAPDKLDDINIEHPDTVSIAQMFAYGIPYASLDADNRWRPTIVKWLLESELMQPISVLCKTECSQDVSQCAIAMLGLGGSYYEMIRIHSPLETIISQKEFLKSERARRSALRRITLHRSEALDRLFTINEIADHSRCLASLVSKERATMGDTLQDFPLDVRKSINQGL